MAASISLEALAWLANALVARGSCLETGEFVLLCSARAHFS